MMRTSLVLFLFFMVATPYSFAWQEQKSKSSEDPIQNWTAIFVNFETNVPLPGIIVDAQVSIPDSIKLQNTVLTSNDTGRINIPLRKGLYTFLNVRGPGWCASGLPILGDSQGLFFEGDAPTPKPENPITIKLYKGTELRGRLLLPEGVPAVDVSLNTGVFCYGTPWVSQENSRRRVSYSVHHWPNWSTTTTTAKDGSFSVTVPPAKARNWIRLGTTRGGFQSIGASIKLGWNKNHPLVKYAPFSLDINGQESPLQVDESKGILELGELRLSHGILFRGHVVDSEGQPLSGVHLFTSSKHGPLAGRKTISLADGSFEFMPMNASTFQLKPDAHLRDEKGRKNSRDVQAVFITQEVTLSEEADPHELIVRALPHIDLEFEWIDRRAKKGPVAYYGSFTLTGQVPEANGKNTWWRGETVKVTRDKKEWLVVKVPATVTNLKIALRPDQRVTPSYQVDNNEIVTGQILLSHFKQPKHRVIYGDEP